MPTNIYKLLILPQGNPKFRCQYVACFAVNKATHLNSVLHEIAAFISRTSETRPRQRLFKLEYLSSKQIPFESAPSPLRYSISASKNSSRQNVKTEFPRVQVYPYAATSTLPQVRKDQTRRAAVTYTVRVCSRLLPRPSVFLYEKPHPMQAQ